MQSIQKAIDAIRQGKIVIMVDDEDRENEGDFVLAGEFATPESINFLAKHGRGLICLAMDGTMIDRLALPMMTTNNRTQLQTAFTVSIEARDGVSTGISAADRARTIQVAVDPKSKPEEIVSPGHVFPLRAVDGGVLLRTGHTEGSVDLAKLAGLQPAAVICEIMNDDGTMARVKDLEKIAAEFDLPIISIKDLVSYRLQRDSLIEPLTSEPETFTWHNQGNSAEFELRRFRSRVDGTEHFSLSLPTTTDTPLVRVHAEAGLDDAFSDHISLALRQIIESKDGGHFVFIRKPETHAETATEYFEKVERQVNQCKSLDNNSPTSIEDTEPTSPQIRQNYLRQIGVGAQILRLLGIEKMRILTKSPKKLVSLDGYGLEIVEKIPFHSSAYLGSEQTILPKETDSHEDRDRSQPIQ